MSLKDAAKGLGIHVGAALNYWEVYDKTREAKYYNIAREQYNLITAETSCKMKPIAKGWNNFDYSKCDYLADFAHKNGMAFRAHALIWAKQPFMPDFIRWEKNAWKIENFMKTYIQTTVRRYKGKAFAWDVVN